MKKRFTVTIAIVALLLFIVVVNYSTEESVKQEKPMEKVLSIDEINAKYEKREEEKQQLIITAINNIVLEEFKKKYELNLDDYKFKGMDTFSEKFLTTLFPKHGYHPRYTFAYIQEKRGYILDKNPNSGENRLLVISKRNNQWKMTKQKKIIGEQYAQGFISSIVKDVRKKYKTDTNDEGEF
ncbi:hypothetical protein [Virgibacillus litoralis]|uniref:DUF3993 domain-containing protein n=1 Tax=Virgibacillus litoralis TaxID=578221 RepID=A0ABS4HA69_9BACI|nr:hypothetical protein [Virgibacillus litoralis]MBP1947549.1 hypothetical protein [Virgibacillus litoralis]